MGTTVFALLVLSGAAAYFMTPEQRVQLAKLALVYLRAGVQAVIHPAPTTEPFDLFLRERTPRAVVTPLLVALNVLVFMGMVLGAGALADPQTQISWGGNYAPLTTNGEWWRLLKSMFVHGGLFHLVITMAALLPLGLILERAVGRFAFAVIYFAAGLFASLVSTWIAPPMGVTFGASGAVAGVYGLLVATLVCTYLAPPETPIPLPTATLKTLAATAVPFFLYTLATDHLGVWAEMAGYLTGLAGGLVVARGVMAEKPAIPRAAILLVATAMITFFAAIPVRGIIDARPEIAKIADVEARTSGAYDKAVENFRVARIPAKDLVKLIDGTIIPDLQEQRTRVSGLRGVPREQAPLVEAAQQYFQLREQSWRRRAEGLLRSNSGILREADLKERAALTAFEKIRPGV